MGAYLSEPSKEKESEDGCGNNVKYGASSMQGWRVSQEDAHNCVAEFDKNSSLFALYDGHGGAEVAIYLSRHLPDMLKKTEGYSKEDVHEALTQTFLQIDASIKEPEVLAEIQKISKMHNGEESGVDYEEENVGQLYEEATMPLEKLVAQYTHNGNEALKEKASDPELGGGPSPCSSRKLIFESSSSGCSGSKGQTSSKDSEIGKPVAETSGPSKASIPYEEGPTSTSSKAEKRIEEVPVSDGGSSSATAIPKNDIGDKVSEGSPSDTSKAEVSVNGSKTEAHSSPEVQKECVNGEVSSSSNVKTEEAVKAENTNGVENEITTSVKEEAEPKPSEISPAKPRKGKVHPMPIILTQASPENKSLRVSPRKGQKLANMAFADSDSDLDSSDSGESATAQFKYNSSSSDEECDEEEEDEDASDDDEDDEDEEDESFLSDIQEPGYDSGSTAVVSFMKWNGDKLNLWVANAGDSRCVVSRGGKAHDMSYDHKPESEVETLRIVKAGGKVTEDGRVNGGLNLSRALGDHSYKTNESLPPEEQMISPLPSIQHIELDPAQDDFIVLACDGVWNSLTSQEVVDFIAQRINSAPSLSKICEELFDECLAPDTYGDGTGCDNMTAIIVQLSKGSKNGTKRSLSEPEVDESSKKPKLEV